MRSISGRALSHGLFVGFGEGNQTGVLVGECRLKAPKCLGCGTIREASGQVFEIHENPSLCCKSGSYVQSGDAHWCYDTKTSCKYRTCKDGVEAIDWGEKLIQLDRVKQFDASNDLLTRPSIREQIDLKSYCSSRDALDLSLIHI